MISNIVDEASKDINQRIASQARSLRSESGVSLSTLAAKSGVSRSMISLIERGEASPTAVIMERLAFGLGVPLAHLFDPPSRDSVTGCPVTRRKDQTQWVDPASGYSRRNVSPPHWPSPIRIVEIEFPAGARVAFETGTRIPSVDQQVWILAGRIRVMYGDAKYVLDAGDSLAMSLDRPISFANRTREPARYAVVVTA